ncbi:BTAD domain-containing putative transcriptional regulator [Lentzea sp. NPDC058450]|uniref:AfsR/SARP family transcriptional regulator n=1 Tax=Lentzea sp. NPDC058450 TaxID=3346505 RepID=UPI003647F5F6
MSVTFRLLGPFETILSGEPVKVGGARQRKLLAVLLLNANRIVSVDQLVAALWENPPGSVRQQVHNSIGSLRRVLAGASSEVQIIRTDTGYRLDVAEDVIDLHRFDRNVRAARDAEQRGDLYTSLGLLDEALSLWRGKALSGLDGVWFETAAASLNENRLAAVEQLASCRIRCGEAASLIGDLTKLVRQHPLRESLRDRLMRALYLSGRQADALAVYEEGRRVLADELALDPGSGLRELHLAILNGSLPVTTTPHHEGTAEMLSAPGSGTSPTKFYLPHDNHDFSGRTAEIAHLLEEAARENPSTLVISAIDGMGGVGKTTLAVHFAHEVADGYPDGQYFVDLHGFTTGMEPITADQALEQLLRDSGVPPELVPTGTEARSHLWRSRTAGTRSLLLVDNAVDAAQVRPLLPGSAGVLVIITSRRRLSALDGAVPMSLDVLSPHEAADMFARVVGERRAEKEPEAVAEAVRLCGHLPLAIRIAAARLRDRDSWTVADLVDRIRDHAHRARFLQVEDRNVMAVLKLSHRYLDPLHRKVFRLLSLHPGAEYDVGSTAALAEISTDQAESCLDGLFDFNLVKQFTPGRFHFHDLVRDCAVQMRSEVDTEDEQQAALRRLFDHYLKAAGIWCQALAHGNPVKEPDEDSPSSVRTPASPAEATAVLNAEFPNLVATARLAAEVGRHAQAWKLVCALEPYLRATNYAGPSYDLYSLAARSANIDGDAHGESLCWSGLASVCRERGLTSEAIRHLDRALELTRRLGELHRESALLIHLGLLRLDMDDYAGAERDFGLAQAHIAEEPDHPYHETIINNQAVVARELGRFTESLEHFTLSLELMPPDDAISRLVTRWNVATVLHAQREHHGALREFGEVLSGSQAIGYQTGIALAQLGLCATQRSLGDYAASVQHGRDALVLARRLNLHRVECEVLDALGETAVAAKDLDHAEKVYAQARERSNHYSFARYEARALEGFAHIAHRRHDPTLAERYWREAVAMYPSVMHDATHARHHLASLDDESATCFRCETP